MVQYTQLDENKALGLDYASHSFYVDSQGKEADQGTEKTLIYEVRR